MDLVADRLRCVVCVLWYGVTVRVCGAVDSTPKGGARQHALRKRACEATAAKRVPPAPERVAAEEKERREARRVRRPARFDD